MATGASIGEWATPTGNLVLDEYGGLSALVSTTLRTEPAVSGSVLALAGLSQAPFIGNAGVQRSELGYILTWPAPPGARRPLSMLVDDWRAEPAAHVALAVASTVSRAIGELQHLAPHRYLISPAQVFLETIEEGRQRWSTLPLPIDAAPLKDMAASSAELIAWVSGD